MKKRNLLLTLVVLICSCNSSMLAQCPPNSGPTEPCEPCKEYPYRVCVYDEYANEMQMQTVCTARPDTLDRIGILFKMDNLPICVELMNNYVHSIGSFENYPEKTGGYLLGLYDQHHRSHSQNDMDLAANKWNCICNHNIADGCGTTISASFVSNWRKFKNPYTDPSSYDFDEGDECEPSDINMYINISHAFLYGTPVPDNTIPLPETPTTHLIMNSHWIVVDRPPYNYPPPPVENNGNFKGVIAHLESKNSPFNPVYKIYSLVDVAIRQLGEILGMGYSEECGCDDLSIMSPEGLWTINGHKYIDPYHGLGGKDNEDWGDCDKCMFKTLYCNDNPCDEDFVFDYEPSHLKIYPNPSNDAVRIEFELEDYCENVTVKIMDVLGRTLLIPIENKPFNSGVHSELINVKGFENGHYYMIIQTTKKSFIKPFIVIR